MSDDKMDFKRRSVLGMAAGTAALGAMFKIVEEPARLG